MGLQRSAADRDRPPGRRRDWQLRVPFRLVTLCLASTGTIAKLAPHQKDRPMHIFSRVYQQSYDNAWWSYEFTQRKTSYVRDYTFRAPGEWFADAYAAFYQGDLSKKHPLYDWFKSDKEKAKGKPKKG